MDTSIRKFIDAYVYKIKEMLRYSKTQPKTWWTNQEDLKFLATVAADCYERHSVCFDRDISLPRFKA